MASRSSHRSAGSSPTTRSAARLFQRVHPAGICARTTSGHDGSELSGWPASAHGPLQHSGWTTGCFPGRSFRGRGDRSAHVCPFTRSQASADLGCGGRCRGRPLSRLCISRHSARERRAGDFLERRRDHVRAAQYSRRHLGCSCRFLCRRRGARPADQYPASARGRVGCRSPPQRDSRSRGRPRSVCDFSDGLEQPHLRFAIPDWIWGYPQSTCVDELCSADHALHVLAGGAVDAHHLPAWDSCFWSDANSAARSRRAVCVVSPVLSLLLLLCSL